MRRSVVTHGFRLLGPLLPRVHKGLPLPGMEVSQSKSTKSKQFVMHKTDTTWSLSFQVAHDKFWEHEKPVCHAVWAKKTAPVVLLWQHIASL